MGKMTIKKKINWMGRGLIVLSIVLFFYMFVLYYYTDVSKSNIGAGRIKFAQLVEALEKEEYDALDEYNGIYVLNSGEIIKSTIPAFHERKKLDLHRFSSVDGKALWGGESYFQSPIVKNGKQVGILGIQMNVENHTLSQKYGILFFIPVILLISCMTFTIIKETRLIIFDVVLPLEKMEFVVKKILHRDYETKITYDYDGTIGELCHDLEELREELYYTKVREEKLKKNEKELLACISHDLKTPLASVSGYVEGIKSGVVKEQKEVDHYLDIIITKTKYISKLIDDILEHSKTELNEFLVEMKEVYAKKLFEEILGDISIDVVQHGFQFQYGKIPNVLILADKNRIVQVIQNIVGNSMKYTDKDGVIQIDFQIFENQLVVSVMDNGKGISMSDLPFIFDKFYRGEKARTLNVPGSGLGLNIAKYIVKRHGGRIECDSVLNEGTTVRFSLRLC